MINDVKTFKGNSIYFKSFKSFKRDNASCMVVDKNLKYQHQGTLTIRYVTLSYLRSKEFQRINLQCMLQHRETSKYKPVYTEMCAGKVVAPLKKQSTFIKASIALITSVCLI